ncbi:efflux RND transporter periplasmic adaptor subunit [Martelella endophytica]|nr:biotin/lipoyl-binding protein [Martelella endophytica]
MMRRDIPTCVSTLIAAIAAPSIALAEPDEPMWIAVADPAAPVRKVPVEMKPFVEEIVRNCKIGYGRPVAVVAPISGRLRVEAQSGQQVTAGDILAQYDTDALQRRADEIQLDVDYLTAQLAYKTGPYRENTHAIQSIDEDDKAAKRDHLAAQVAEMKRLYGQGRLALGRFQEAQRDLDAADNALKTAERQHDSQRREAALDEIRLGNDLEKRKNALTEASEKLSSATVRATASGRLVDVETSSAADGKLTVSEGERLALLVDPHTLGARVQFGNQDMRLVRAADVAVVPNADGAPRKASISAIRSVERPEERERGEYTTEVEVAFSDPQGPALINTDATCHFTKPQAEEAPAVPVSAVLIQDDHSFVRKLEGNGAKLIEVKLGDVDEDYVRVLSGLKPGDLVLE